MKLPILGGVMGKTLITSLENFFIFKGEIAVAADFPTSAEVKLGWTFHITASVTDNDPTKTNTGQTFQDEDEIFWNGTNWTIIGTVVITDHGALTGLSDDDHAPYLLLAGRSGQTLSDALTITGSLAVDSLIFNANIITTASAQDLFIFANSADVNINPDLRIHLGDPPVNDVTRMSFVGGGSSISDSASIAYFNAPDKTYPIRQEVSLSHDNITYFFDSYTDNTNDRSSDAGSNYKMEKKSDQLIFKSASGFAQGAVITWNTGFYLDTSGSVTFNKDIILNGRQINPSVAASIVSNNLDVSNNKTIYRITSTESSPDQVDTISAGVDGQKIYIINETSAQVQVRSNQAPGANNNIFTSGGSITLNQNQGYLMFIYNSNIDTNGAWVTERI
ncbi:MAG: hypothetical protein V3V84_00705 [Candidatus Bathyarchaeia archaeon]